MTLDAEGPSLCVTMQCTIYNAAALKLCQIHWSQTTISSDRSPSWQYTVHRGRWAHWLPHLQVTLGYMACDYVAYHQFNPFTADPVKSLHFAILV